VDRILLFIPMYNCEKQIIRVLAQLTPDVTKYFTEVIVINNRSTDNGENAVIEYCQKSNIAIPIKLLRNDANYNLGGSHKVAFNYAIENECDYVIVLHGDDQGSIKDFLMLLKSGEYRHYDCCLGSRFIKGARLEGYSRLRILGNYGFNLLFSIAARKMVYDLGSGLNIYSIAMLKDRFYYSFPDTLYFNVCMILASYYYNHRVKFIPISWREEDQVSNNKLVRFSLSLLNMLGTYLKGKETFLQSELRDVALSHYSAEEIWPKKEGMQK
jgi:glycosyltransferase involved in cell wall biosynthesis